MKEDESKFNSDKWYISHHDIKDGRLTYKLKRGESEIDGFRIVKNQADIDDANDMLERFIEEQNKIKTIKGKPYKSHPCF